MSPDGIRQIESALGITLPDVYRRLMSPFPVRHLSGNADRDLWDNPGGLIERNEALRNDEYHAWPKHWLFIGDPLSGSANAIDLRDPSAPVAWVDHCDLRTVDGKPGTSFEQWLSRWLTDIRSDLASDGIDPDSEPPAPPKDHPVWLGRSVIVLVAACCVAAAIGGSILLVRDLIF